VINAETTHRRRFLDLVRLSARPAICPFLYDAIERKKFGASDSGEIVRKATIDQRIAGVKIKSLVGDNHPMQVRVLAHWSPRSFLNNHDPELSGIRFQAYICHVLCLVMAYAFAQSS
jgi:hypothetical protein